MKKTIAIFTALTTVLWLSGIAMIFPAQAATFADGDLARESDEFDVYIIKLVNDKQFKRLILNPDVFNMYGHLSWDDIQVVDDGALDDYETSELVRADGDDKVYKLYPDGDVGTKKWVESLDCFTSQGFDWDSVYVINTFDRDSYTTADTSLCEDEEEEEEEGEMTFSLSSDTAETETIPYNAQSVPFLTVDVDGSGTITQMVFERFGVGEASDFDNAYLYENGERLTSGRSVSSSTDQVTFIGLDIEAPTTLTVKADLAASEDDANHIDGFKLVSASDVTTDATVGGSFPVAGNKLTISSIEGGKITVDRTGSVANPNVGENNVQISKFKLTADSEPIKMHSLALYNGGSMNSTEITNLELEDIVGDVVATADTFSSDDIVTLEFSSPYEIGKGESEIFELYGDLEGDVDDTIILYFEVSADVYGIGQNYGSTVQADIDSFSSTTDAHELTLQGGELTISNNNPTATDIGDDTNDTVLMELAYTAGSDLEIRKSSFYVCWHDDDVASDEDMEEAETEITDIKLINKDTGTVLMGPTDGDGFDTTTESSLDICDTSTYEGEIGHEWSDTWDISAGETVNVQLTMDIEASDYIASDDAFAGILEGYTNLSNPVKYTGTNDYVATADIVPSGNIEGNDMTVKQSSIDVDISSLPSGDVNAVKGESDVEVAAFIFTAGDASDMELTDLVLTVFVDGEGTGDNYEQGYDNPTYAKDVISSATLYDADGNKLSGGGSKSVSGDDYSDLTFDDLSWTIPAGESKKMIVKVDVTTTAVEGSEDDYIALDIIDTDDVTAIDDQGNSRESSSEDVNGDISDNDPDVYLVKADGGTLTVAAASAGVRREQTYIYQGQAGAEFSKFKFTSTEEAFLIDKIRLKTDNTDDLKYFDKVELEYPIDADGTMVRSTRPSGNFPGSTASVTFSLTEEMYVPKDDHAYLTVYANMGTYAEAGDTDESYFGIDLECGTDTADFHAIGEGSSIVIEGNDLADVSEDIDSDVDMYIKRVFPSFTLDSSAGDTYNSMAAVDKVLQFTITNNGDYELIFSSASGELDFDVLGSGQETLDAEFSLYKSDDTLVETTAVDNTGGGKASVSFDFDAYSVTIPEDGSQSFYIKINSGATNWDGDGDHLKLQLDNIDDSVEWEDGADDTQSEYKAGTKYIGIPLDGPTWLIDTD
ncbi:MAG: hypothetical protein ACOC80_07365 [Petrotogales bacterium]